MSKIVITHHGQYAKIGDDFLRVQSAREGHDVLVLFDPPEMVEMLVLFTAVNRYIADHNVRNGTEIRYGGGEVLIGTVNAGRLDLAGTDQTQVGAPADMDESFERELVIAAMQASPDRFTARIGKALENAPADHAERIQAAFPEMWAEYLEKGKASESAREAAQRRIDDALGRGNPNPGQENRP